MKTFPIIPIWLMSILCIALFLFLIKDKKQKVSIKSILILIFLFLLNLRFMIPTNHGTSVSSQLDVLFVIDNTISVLATDYKDSQTRLSGIQETAEYIIEELSGARFSIISFNNTSQQKIPFTTDKNIALETIQILYPIDNLYARGSSLNTPLEDMISVLKAETEKQDNKIRIVFFLSDGEITDESDLESFQELSKYIDGGAVLGYGTTKGATMLQKNYYGEYEYIKDYENNYENAISKIDEANLKQIAQDMNIDYIHVERQEDITQKISEIKKLESTTLESNDKRDYEDIYYIFLIPIFLLLLLHLKDGKGGYI